MPLSVDPRKIVHVHIIRWDSDGEGHPTEYGLAWTASDGSEGADKIGTRAQAEAIIRSIKHQRAARRVTA